MSGTSEVLQEYLIKLGFQTDSASLHKFQEGLGSTGKKILGIGTKAAAAVTAVEAATAAFAYSMRKNYFQAELSKSTVSQMHAMSYAGKQLGLSGDAVRGSVKALADTIVKNPGMQGLIESFGVKVSGRDMSDVAVDWVKALKSMPTFQGIKFAEMTGMDSDTFRTMSAHIDEFEAKRKQMLDMYKQSGVDPEAAKRTLLEYTAGIDELESRLSLLGQTLLIRMAPGFKAVNVFINKFIDDFTKSLSKGTFIEDYFGVKGAGEGEDRKLAQIRSLTDLEAPKAKPAFKQEDLDSNEKFLRMSREKAKEDLAPEKRSLLNAEILRLERRKASLLQAKNEVTPSPTGGAPGIGQPAGVTPEAVRAAPATTHPERLDLMGKLEGLHQLPAGLLDKVWKQESGRGANMMSSAGAQGHFQFMPKTAEQYKVENPFDFKQAATGAAKMYSELLEKYKGNLAHALAAYNWGSGNVDAYLKTGKGAKGQEMPKETQDYVKKISGLDINERTGKDTRLGAASPNVVTQNNTTNIQVTGAGADTTARAVAKEQSRVMGDGLRMLKGSMS